MIISKTPLRISFFCGGTDIEPFYRHEKGAALSATINKYVYVNVNRTPYNGIRMMYDETEDVTNVEDLKGIITKETLKYMSITDKVTIASLSDVKARGSGLGSSSAFTVGLLLALKTSELQYEELSPFQLAEDACHIEINLCKNPIGKQDQYAASLGGFNLFEFEKDGSVQSLTGSIDPGTIQTLQSRLLLVHSGLDREASNILAIQAKDLEPGTEKFKSMQGSRFLAYQGKKLLEEDDVVGFGDLLGVAWEIKKQRNNTLIRAGARAGKLLGAGGGGFFLFYVPEEKMADVSQKALDIACFPYQFEFTDQGAASWTI